MAESTNYQGHAGWHRRAMPMGGSVSGLRRALSRSGSRLLWLLALMAPLAATAATSVYVMSVSPGKAQVSINGSAVRTLSLGQTTPEGVTLNSATATVAELLVDGRMVALGIGQTTVEKIEILADSLGRYYVPASINGVELRGQIDTGANVVVLNRDDADRVGVNFADAKSTGATTANGRVRAYEVRLASVKIGNITVKNVRAAVVEGGPGQLPHALIGMSFLQELEMRNVGRRMELIQKRF